jgi:hypothetical protein
MPDIYAAPSMIDVMNNRDVVLDAAIRAIVGKDKE